MHTWHTRLSINKNMQNCLIIDPSECGVCLTHKGIHCSTPGKDQPLAPWRCGVRVRVQPAGGPTAANCGQLHPP